MITMNRNHDQKIINCHLCAKMLNNFFLQTVDLHIHRHKKNARKSIQIVPKM